MWLHIAYNVNRFYQVSNNGNFLYNLSKNNNNLELLIQHQIKKQYIYNSDCIRDNLAMNSYTHNLHKQNT
jgi:hypothetical protein